jgi:hypothetical protein
MSSLDWVYPVDLVEDIKEQPGGVYKKPNKWVSMGKFWDEIRTIVWIDPRVFDNETNEEDVFDLNEEWNWEIEDGEIEDGEIENEINSWDIDIIITDGAASCCTWDKMYSWLEDSKLY